MSDLTITVIKGVDLKPTSIFAKASSMQCYCKIFFGSNYNWSKNIFKTKPSSKSNYPEWDATFNASIKNPTQSQVKILVKDKLALMDNLVGEALFALGDQSLHRGAENVVTIPVKKGGHTKGHIVVSIIPHTFGTAQNTVIVQQQTVVQQPTVVQTTHVNPTPPPYDPYASSVPPPSSVAPPLSVAPPTSSVPPPSYGTVAPPPQNGSPYGTVNGSYAPPPSYSSVPPPQQYGNPPPNYTNPPPNYGNPQYPY